LFRFDLYYTGNIWRLCPHFSPTSIHNSQWYKRTGCPRKRTT